MVFPVVGGNESKVYEISNSLRFNDNDSASLSRAFSTDPSDQKLTTISFWFKIGNITSAFRALYRFNDGSNTGAIYLRSGNDLQFAWDLSSGSLDVRPDGVFRDPSAWYHCHIKVDTTQGTAANRVIIRINGVERSYGTATYPGQNTTLKHLSNGKTYYVGGSPPNSDYYFDGYVTEFHVIDGQAKDYTDFGEFDNNGVWIPKRYTGTYGNNGFYLQFKQTGTSANSSGIGADTSGNDNHFTPTNLAATDITEDTCTNNFATLNALNYQTSSALSEGNTKIVGVNADQFLSSSSIGVDKGKWYVEAKLIALSGGQAQFGITSDASEQNRNNRWVGQDSYSYGLASNDGLYNNASTVTYSNATYTTNDIISIALDLDNNLIYFYKNGTVMNSGTGYSITDPASTTNGFYFFAVSDGNSDYNATWEMNFGNPPFSISSGNNDGKYGNFEYAPPSGYYALCTKRLAEFG